MPKDDFMMARQVSGTETSGRSGDRLTPLDRKRELLPWRKAHEVTGCSLFWIPVDAFPPPSGQIHWLQEFFSRFHVLLQAKLGLRPEQFLQLKTIQQKLMDEFLGTMLEFGPMLGLSRRPGAALPSVPTEDDIRAIIEGKKTFDFGEYVADFCYWFLDSEEAKQRQIFLGHVVLAVLLLKPDPNTQPPPNYIPLQIRQDPVFRNIDSDRARARTYRMLDGFQAKSKELFGQDLKNNLQAKHVPFVVPLLQTKDFFEQPQEIEKCFSLFDVYMNESPADKGMILASSADLEDDLITLLAEMKQNGLQYGER